MLGFPEISDENFIKRVYSGNKRVLNSILYFCLKNLENLKNRAYLGNFLVPLTIPDEYLLDDDLKNQFKEY